MLEQRILGRRPKVLVLDVVGPTGVACRQVTLTRLGFLGRARVSIPGCECRSSLRGTVAACHVSTGVYTFGMKAARAKLFQNGGSQAVRLPRDCRFPEGESEVVVRRVGRRVILEPVEEWPDEFLKSLGSLSAEIPRLKGVPITKLRDPFA